MKISLVLLVGTLHFFLLSHDHQYNRFLSRNAEKWYKYVKLKLSTLPAKIIQEYKLLSIVPLDGSVYVEVQKGIYGLSQTERPLK